jgi:hypothetical protein
MSSRTNLRPQIVIPAALATPANTGSMAANIASQPTIMQSLSMVSYGLSWTGTSPVGTASIQFSNDYSLNPNGTVNNAGTWNTVTIGLNGSPVSSIPITGNTGSAFIDIESTGAYACRLLYTYSSGTGTLTVTANGKVQ